MDTYCYGCHGGGIAKGGVTLDEFANAKELKDHARWLRALRNVRSGIMPPAEEPQLPKEVAAKLSRWIKRDVFELDPAVPDPGRVTVRRLNRVEYRNTVRDLTGVEVDTKLNFPVDDSGHGFDNIGDVLTVSPMLLEKYLDTAQTIIAAAAPMAARARPRFHQHIDAWVLHPVWGLVILAALLFVVFQAVFSWANAPMDAIKAGMAALGSFTTAHMADGPLRSLLVDGAIAGAGSVLVFLPQILILFFFILVLEDSGYLPRAAFLLDSLMGKVGLSGRAFIPLLSSFACAVPGVMATRTIADWKDRLATIMVAPLMTCSARLPVYALLIGAFVPDRPVGPGGVLNLRGLTLFALYLAGVLSAMAVAWVFKRLWLKSRYQPLMLELPPYRWPSLRSMALGLWERATIFLRRVGTIIFALVVVLWFLSSYPAPPDGATGAAIQYSLAGQLGRALE
ncbi:MAG: hypothetical protein CFE45_21025, partial [Burkholderiales bacterium PBB5]